MGLYLAVDWLVSHRLVDVISLSWGEPDVGTFNAFSGACTSECNATTDGSYEILSPVLQAAAVEGIGVFVATGDCGAADGTSGVSTDYPASDPSAVAVGGTDLSVTSSGIYQSEVGWSGNSSGASSPGCQNQGGSGGGYSPFPRPYWQAGLGVPSSPATRGIPDVAADASHGVTIVQGGGDGGVGGTSLSTPVWAGMAAIADQYAGHDLGQLDPAVYATLRSANYSTDFHDIVSGNNGYSAGTGWDPVTGAGSPIVGQLVKDLGRPSLSESSLRVLLYSNRTYGSTPLTVRFGVAPTGGTGSYPLEGVYFGDGTSELAPGGIVAHTFSRAGVYTAVAFAADSSGNLTSSTPVAIVVGGGGPLNVTLTPSMSSPGVDAPVTFSTTVQGGTAPFSYVYDFGDGTFLNLSSAATVGHAYGTAGGFCAAVVAEDSADPPDGARSAPVSIAVGGASSPVCSNASAPLTVSADAVPGVRDAPADFPSLFQVSGGVTGSGGSGTTEVLTSSDPYVAACGCTIFRAPGTYSVSLTATDLIDERATNETNVTVTPPLSATFAVTPTFGPAPLTVQFEVALHGGYLADANQTRWNFGDGTGATGALIEHTYTTPGFYSATGGAADRGQGNASEGFLVNVLPSGSPSTPGLTATFAPAVNLSSGTTVHFTAHTVFPNGSAAPAQVFWDLGENGTAWGPAAAQTSLRGRVRPARVPLCDRDRQLVRRGPEHRGDARLPATFCVRGGRVRAGDRRPTPHRLGHPSLGVAGTPVVGHHPPGRSRHRVRELELRRRRRSDGTLHRPLLPNGRGVHGERERERLLGRHGLGVVRGADRGGGRGSPLRRGRSLDRVRRCPALGHLRGRRDRRGAPLLVRLADGGWGFERECELPPCLRHTGDLHRTIDRTRQRQRLGRTELDDPRRVGFDRPTGRREPVVRDLRHHRRRGGGPRDRLRRHLGTPAGPAAYPLTTPSGVRRATRRVRPAPSATRTTSSTSL